MHVLHFSCMYMYLVKNLWVYNMIISYVNAVVKNEYTDYGFMESELSANKEVILIIRRNNRNHDLPQHHLIVFNKNNINDDTSKVYIYNVIKNTVSTNQGNLYYFCCYTINFMIIFDF